MSDNISQISHPKVAVIGGGMAGSTIALRLSELGIATTLFDKGSSLVNGPPMCHLHAGGNLYRDISDEQCFALLEQSIDTLKVYRNCVDWRPTVIALPTTDKSTPAALLPRLHKLQAHYQSLIAKDSSNAVLGEPEHYFRPYQREQLEQLALRDTPKFAQHFDDWLIPVAKTLDLDALQFPVFLVQEYGLNAFRLAATASLAMTSLEASELRLQHRIVDIERQPRANNSESLAANWRLISQDQSGELKHWQFDYVVNACGFQTGEIDDLLQQPRQRMVEFKAAYVAYWHGAEGQWPEVIIHGERGTPQGMAQLTPYANGFFQLHGMTKAITLFEDGLVATCAESAQPKLAQPFIDKIEQHWPAAEVQTRTKAAIAHVAQYLPAFANAKVGTKPMYGAQQIPGADPGLRAADVSFCCDGYARAEIVKASSALAAADAILSDMVRLQVVSPQQFGDKLSHHHLPVTKALPPVRVAGLAAQIAAQRDYAAALAEPIKAVV
ncbi:oxidoreductase [Neiella marina]|uniref:Oxidoreductase n=1 Tax=Neiella marina TaxID=508461 RepID=A0A8J2U4N0_9GAMM|nr:FAD-dependent oxidoreductase [Neiella marina]GGA76199.1 oxidoreductase [Neiella marina]